MRRAIRSFACALSLLVLAAGALHARPVATHRPLIGFLDTLRHWVGSFIPRVDEGGTMNPDGFTRKAGSTMDPDGKAHTPASPPSTTNAGGMMDPDG
jgi:hypothetical protein